MEALRQRNGVGLSHPGANAYVAAHEGNAGLSTAWPRIAATRTLPTNLRKAATAALALADALAFVLAFGLAGSLGKLGKSGADGFAGQAPLTLAVLAAGVLTILAYRGHYSLRQPFWTELKHVVTVSVIGLLLSFGLAFLDRLPMAVGPVGVFWAAFPALAMVLRNVLRRVFQSLGLWQIRTVVVGHRGSTATAIAALESERWLGYDVAAVVTPAQFGDRPPDGRWRSLLHDHQAGLAVLAMDPEQPVGRDLVGSLVRERVPFAIAPSPAGLPVLGFEQTQFFSHDALLITYRNNLAKRLPRLVKTLFDLAAASIGLFLAAPVFLVIAALVRLDGGPVFYGHTRVGAGGRPFRCLKFRSMVVDSDARLTEHLAGDPHAAEEWARTRKLRNDPRITRVGRILRTTSLDELPQLLNVLRLEMSLVGPRPIVRAELHHYGEDIAFYYETRPGLTGLWQVSGRTGTTFARRVELDCWYVKNWTLWHDIAILAATIPAVLKRRGAC